MPDETAVQDGGNSGQGEPNVDYAGATPPAQAPPEQNLRGENDRLRRELSNAKSQAARAPAPAPAPNSRDYNSLPDPMDMSKDDLWNTIHDIAENVADFRSEVRLSQYDATQKTQSAQATKQGLTDQNSARFREERGWTDDGETWGKFVTHMNTVVGTGEKGELTHEQFTQQEMAFRGAEALNEAASNAQGKAIEGMRNSGTRTPRSRASNTDFKDLSVGEQVDILAEGSPQEAERRFQSLDEGDQRKILMIIDPETQPEPL
jgi:hypothetical protein